MLSSIETQIEKANCNHEAQVRSTAQIEQEVGHAIYMELYFPSDTLVLARVSRSKHCAAAHRYPASDCV